MSKSKKRTLQILGWLFMISFVGTSIAERWCIEHHYEMQSWLLWVLHCIIVVSALLLFIGIFSENPKR